MCMRDCSFHGAIDDAIKLVVLCRSYQWFGENKSFNLTKFV